MPIMFPNPTPRCLSVRPGFSANEVKESIIAAFIGREWSLRESADLPVTGYLKHRGREVFLMIAYTATSTDLT
jgi:hypothetical protein